MREPGELGLASLGRIALVLFSLLLVGTLLAARWPGGDLLSREVAMGVYGLLSLQRPIGTGRSRGLKLLSNSREQPPASNDTGSVPPFPPIFPLPHHWENGSMTVNLVPDFKFEIASSSKDLLSLAARYRKICFPRKARWAPNRQDRSTALTKLQLVVTSPDHVLSPHTDESYTLLLPAGGKGEGGRVAVLEASTQFGAMRGLETFSQLLHFDFDLSAYRVLHAPWQVKDKPRFPHRELLVDSARHFLPVRVLKDLLSSLSFAKINVLHWHLADTQSFPMQSRNNPELSRRGSFSSDETYSEDDVAEIVEWGRMRGVRVLPEIDMPGHAASWCRGYPKICPSPSCLEPLSPVMPTPLTPFASDDTFTVVERLMGDVVSSFPEPLLHLGGDEVNTSCWEASESIKGWMKQNNLTTGDAFKLFLLRAHAMAAKFHRRPVVWDEVWDVVGANLSKDVIIQQWRWGGNHVNRTKNVTSNGYQLIWMVDPDWYLDSLSTGWEKIHTTDLCEGLTEEECERVIGGGGGMWGETVDASDLEQTVWPRMAALAEVLWSPAPTGKRSHELAWSLNVTRSRLKAFRCLLLQRGVRAAPVDNAVARTAPSGPGGCRDA